MTDPVDVDPLPGVSYVMPVLNEADHIGAAVASILGQDYPAPTELVLALGPSSDDTDAIVARLQAHDDRIRLVTNPGPSIPIGLNLAIGESTHPVIVRVDGHAELPPGYTRQAVRTLLQREAASVGGIMAAAGRPGLQAMIARAYNSRLGLGGGAYHHADAQEGEAESAYLGVMRADALAAVGGYDEALRRGEDWELNLRLREAGYRVWLDPQLRVTYWPRRSWAALARQFHATGRWRGELVRRVGAKNSLRYFAPPTLVLATGATVVLVPLTAAGGLTGGSAAVALVIALGPASYVGLLAVLMATTPGPALDRLRFGGVLATMHFCWGAGFLRGLLRGAQDAPDRSRHAE